MSIGKSSIKTLKDKYILEIDVPGYSSSDVNVEVKHYTYDILGCGQVIGEGKKLCIVADNELRGKYSIEFGIEFVDMIDLDGIEANVKDGLLAIQLPFKKKHLPRNIPVS